MTTVWTWLHGQYLAEPVEFVEVALFVLGVPVAVVWGVWLARRTG